MGLLVYCIVKQNTILPKKNLTTQRNVYLSVPIRRLLRRNFIKFKSGLSNR